jgi:hypothetical protein
MHKGTKFKLIYLPKKLFIMENVKINKEQKLYVIPCGGGYSCYGFEVLKNNKPFSKGIQKRRFKR